MSRAEAPSGCPECGGRLIAESGEHVCAGCGLVAATNRIDTGPEWRGGTDDADRRRRTGAPLTPARHDRGLSTEIGYASGAELPEGNPRRLARLRREHNRAKISTKAERNLVYGFTEIRRICSSLGLPRSLRDRACVLFERAQDEGLFQGRSVEGFAAAAVYAACRVEGVARTRGEVVEVSRATRAELEAAYDALNRDLRLPAAPIDPREYLPRFASALELDTGVERTARGYAASLIEAGLVVGRKPSGVAGACLYAAASDHGERVSQAEVAEVAEVSPVTLRGVTKLIPEVA